MAYTAIGATRVDLDSPLDEDLMSDLADNDQYLHDGAVRGGTNGTPVRLTLARGSVVDTATTNGSGAFYNNQITVTFSTDSDDGNPNFLATPIVVCTPQESGASTDWGSGYKVGGNILEASKTSTGFVFEWWMEGGPATQTVGVILNWIAVGLVTGGE